MNWLNNAPDKPTFVKLEKDFTRLAAHANSNFSQPEGNTESVSTPGELLAQTIEQFKKHEIVEGESARALDSWLSEITPYVDETKKNGRVSVRQPPKTDFYSRQSQ